MLQEHTYFRRFPQLEALLKSSEHVVVSKEDWELVQKKLEGASESNFAHFTKYQIGEKVYAVLNDEEKPGFIVQISIREKECTLYEVSFGSGDSKWFYTYELTKEFVPK